MESDKNLQVVFSSYCFVFFKILLHLPYSRKLEEEADEVGMNMAAKVQNLNLFFFNLF